MLIYTTPLYPQSSIGIYILGYYRQNDVSLHIYHFYKEQVFRRILLPWWFFWFEYNGVY